MKLPIFKLKITEKEDGEEEVDFISLVDRPAVEKNFLVFSKEKARFQVEDEMKRILTGVAMLPDVPIYRSDDNLGEYFVVFDKQTIEDIAIRFFKKGYQRNMNMQHKAGANVQDSVYFESWIVDRAKGKNPPPAFADVPEGTWLVSAKINDDAAWAKVMSGEFKGFSIEGFFIYEPVAEVDPVEATMKEINNILSQVE